VVVAVGVFVRLVSVLVFVFVLGPAAVGSVVVGYVVLVAVEAFAAVEVASVEFAFVELVVVSASAECSHLDSIEYHPVD